jgi:hypothetical protein
VKSDVPPEIARHFCDELRDARAVALQDAEGFSNVLFAVERLGAFVAGRIEALGRYREGLRELAARSPLANDIPIAHPGFHVTFDVLYDLVMQGRNDAMHQGAAARHLTGHAVELALILEDALMSTDAHVVRDFMVRTPVCARLWEPVSSIRRSMLANAFSYLPVFVSTSDDCQWKLVSDVAVAAYLRGATGPTDRKQRLATSLEAAVESGRLALLPARICKAEDHVKAVLGMFEEGRPMLVLRPNCPNEAIGLLTPFDLL